ncbi:MAG: enzyme [Cryobacterium sp.]|nr:enzyme [Cryobacterium sp.]
MKASNAKVGLVFVSHSAKIADGLVDLARQMAGSVVMIPAGGTDEAGIGTSFEKVSMAMAKADSGAGVVVLTDLGSAVLTADTALDFLDDVLQARVRIVDAPFVEGGVAAAVAAELGGDLAAVASAALAAGTSASSDAASAVSPTATATATGTAATTAGADTGSAEGATGHSVSRVVTLINRDGLHARPAAEFVKLASTFDTHVTVNGKDAKSLLGIMSLGLVRGMRAEIEASGEQAEHAVQALAELVESGFGEA